MQYRTNAFDVWTFQRDRDAVRYLLLHTSQEKADRWFSGGRFWQIPTEFFGDDESVVDASCRCLADLGIAIRSLWSAEHAYTIYNRRREEVALVLVLAAEAQNAHPVKLSWEHSECRRATAAECEELLTFRGLLEGLHWTRRYVTEAPASYPELRLA